MLRTVVASDPFMADHSCMTGDSDNSELQALRHAIGRVIQFRGQPCRIMEILDDGPSVVIECLDASKAIQANQFGDATRRVSQTMSIPIYDRGDTLSADYLDLKQALEERPV